MTITDEQVTARSILMESDGQYQPHGNAIGFFSERSGLRQLWIEKSGNLRQISNFDNQQRVDFFVWSPDGKQFAVLVGAQLYLFDLNGNYQLLKTPFRPIKLYQWSDDGQLLISAIEDEQIKLLTFDINREQHLIHYKGYTRWAQMRNDVIYFTDKELHVQRLQQGKKSSVTKLQSVTSWSRFFIRNERLYLLSNDDKFWSFHFETKLIKEFFQYGDPSIAVTDVDPINQSLLISKNISAQKEIVLLHN